MDSADPLLAVHGFYAGRYRQHRRHSTEQVDELDGPFGADPARIAVFHRSLLVRAAVCGQMAQQTIAKLNGGLAIWAGLPVFPIAQNHGFWRIKSAKL
jgi:hypothetical protein